MQLLRLSFWVFHVFNYCFYGTLHEIIHFWHQMKMPRGVLLTYYSCATVSKILKPLLIAPNSNLVLIICDLEWDIHFIYSFLALTNCITCAGDPNAQSLTRLFRVRLMQVFGIDLSSE